MHEPRNATLIDAEVTLFERDGQAILKDVRWVMSSSQHWAILGANGSGKSTLLKIVAGYEWPSAGAVSVLGQRYGSCYMPAVKQRIGLVNAALYEWFPSRQTAIEVVASGLYATIGSWQRFSESDLARASEALDRIRVADVASKPYGVLSQGEKQRVMIARALIRQPELLILDEPCAGLDPGAREAFLADVEQLCAQGPSLVLVTHHIEEIPRCVTHALVLKHGQVLAQGTATEVITDETLSRAFRTRCRVTAKNGRFALLTGDVS